jgi:hypothetical protein
MIQSTNAHGPRLFGGLRKLRQAIKSTSVGGEELMVAELPEDKVEELLGHFATAALGLALEGRIHDPMALPQAHRSCLTDPAGRPRTWVAWRTDQGTLSACALYDSARSSYMKAHVMKISWWIGSNVFSDSWWYCYPKRPCEWIKGNGRLSVPAR